MEKQPNVRLVEESQSYKLIIPLNVELTIRRLLQEIYNIEWSGILFCTHTGTFEDRNLTITCRDILPLNVGSVGFTEFEMGPEVISYMVDNNLLDCECQLIHSHHRMATFFSSTDTNTLITEGFERNNFVSLIVNNDGTYNAKITRKELVKVKRNGTRFIPFFGNAVTPVSFEDIVEENIVHAYPLEIIKDYGKDEALMERIKALKEEANKRNSKVQAVLNDSLGGKKTEPELFDDSDWNIEVLKEVSESTAKKVVKDNDGIECLSEACELAAAKLLSLCLIAKKLPTMEEVKRVSTIYKDEQLDETIEPFTIAVVDDAIGTLFMANDNINREELEAIVRENIEEILEEYQLLPHVKDILQTLNYEY